MIAQAAPAPIAGAACAICGLAGCGGRAFTPHTPDLLNPFVPGVTMAKTNGKTATERLFDADGNLVAGEGEAIPDGETFTAEQLAARTAGEAAAASTKRAPKREAR